MDCGIGAVTPQVSAMPLASCSLDSLEWWRGADARQGKVSQHSCGSLGAREMVRAGIVGRVVTLRIFPRSNHESHQARDGEQRDC